MKRRKIIIFILPIFIIIGIIICVTYNYKNNVNIEKILKSKNYSYLSDNVKEYIRNYYNETGVVLLTEQNKEEGQEYLNPDYVEYLEDESNYGNGYIPSVLISDYNYDYNLKSTNEEILPEKYDSRNVNGKNYTTPLKRQYNQLCWNYAYTAVVESKLLKSGLETDPLTLDLSERMMDYATTDPISAIDVEKNPYFGNYTLMNLSEGGNEFRYSSVLVNGLFPVSENNWKYEEDYMGKVRPEDVYDFDKTIYQMNEVLFLKDDNLNVGLDENTNKLLKKYIMEHGTVGVSLRVGAGKNYVRYKATEENKLNSNSNYNYLYYKDASALYQSNDHMVAIIGWNDTFTRNICINEKGELTDSTNNNGEYSCPEGSNLKTIKGAWITKDSANTLYNYLAYETVNSQYFVTTDISKKDWDNVYSSSNSQAYTKINDKYVFNKLEHDEKLNSIKFYSNKEISNIKVYIDNYDGTGEKLLTEINTKVGGLYTIPITDEILLSSDKFSIRTTNNYKITQFSIFTNNISEEKVLKIDDAEVVNSFNYQDILGNYQNVIITKGISKNYSEDIDYVVKNSRDIDVTDLFNISRNYPVGNYIYSLFKFNDETPQGEYTVYAYIDETLYDTFKLKINRYMENISGDGSEENPFIITNPTQLDMIRLNKYNYYKLGNDIDLTYDTQNKNGLFYNDGLGWNPISYSTCDTNYSSKLFCSEGFSGIFDGNNHKIIGLYINRPNENAVGLFRTTYNDNFAGLNFRNLSFEDVNIVGKDFVGSLIGYAYGTTYERTLVFENISVTGSVKGNNYVGGIIGYFKGGTGLKNYLLPETNCIKRHCLQSLFNSSRVEGNNYVGGIIGLLETQNYYNVNNPNWRSTIDANYWQNNGTIISHNNASGLIGHINISNGNIVTIGDSINTGIVKSSSSTGIVNDVECNNSEDIYPMCSLVLNNIYYTDEVGHKPNEIISSNNIKNYNIGDLTNYDLYKSFTNFNTYYKTETVNDIKRIPFVKNAEPEYVNVEDINIDDGKSVNIYDYIDGNESSIEYTISDETIATIDEKGVITPLKNGSTTINITSHYDGYNNDINLTIEIPNITYTITYNLNGGTAVNPTTYTVSTETFTLNQPTKTGYTFTGWTGSNGETMQLDVAILRGTTGNLIYNANWTPLKYTVTFDANGGTGTMSKQTYTHDVFQNLKNNVYTKEGYEFVEWNTKPDGTGTNYLNEEGITITKDIKLYAIWNPLKYTVAFNSNGGTGTMEKQTYTHDVSQKLSNNLYTREGYTFAGWNTEPDGTGTNYSDGQNVKMIKDIKLYAIWNPLKYTVTFDANGGYGTMEKQTYTHDVSQNLKSNLYTKEGYEFVGWNTKSDGTGTSYSNGQKITIVKDIRVYAIWKKITYTITYNLYGGEITNPTTYTIESETFTLKQPSREGYKFTGWTGSNGSTPQVEITITKGAKGNLTYNANWTPVKYSITYDLDGGEITNPTTYTIESETFTLKQPSREGYKFTGWTGSNGSTPQVEITITKSTTGNLTYKANWTPVKYSITYDLDGGEITNLTTYTIESETFTLKKPSREGYKFTGWTGSNGTTPQVEITITKGTTGNLTYKANWTPVTYTITYELNGGEITNPTTYTIESETFTLKQPSREGYKFTGWTGSNGSTPQVEITITKGTTGNLSYEANWNPLKYNITFDSNSGTGTMEKQTFTYDVSQKINKNTYKKDGYVFNGWNTKKDATGTNYSDEQEITLSKNITLYAIWVPMKYTITFDSNSGAGTMEKQTFTHDVSQKINKNTYKKENHTFIGWNTKKDATGTNYSDEQEITLSKNITLYAIWEEKPAYVISNYFVNEKEKIIKGIPINTTEEQLRKNIKLDDSYTLEIVKSKEHIGTNTTIKIYKNKDILYKEFTAIVKGDVTGDGQITLADLSRFYNYYQKNITMNKYYELAADVNESGNFSLADLSKFYNYYQGNINNL